MVIGVNPTTQPTLGGTVGDAIQLATLTRKEAKQNFPDMPLALP